MSPLSTPRRLAVATLVLVAVVITSLLHWPLPLQLNSAEVHAHFHGSHVWCFDHIVAMLTGAEPFEHHTRRIGFPESVQLRFIAWVPALASAPLRLFLGPLGAYNFALLLSPAFSALAASVCSTAIATLSAASLRCAAMRSAACSSADR